MRDELHERVRKYENQYRHEPKGSEPSRSSSHPSRGAIRSSATKANSR
jgi:hypothetical protein